MGRSWKCSEIILEKNLACFEEIVGWNVYIKNAFGGISELNNMLLQTGGKEFVVIKQQNFILVFCGKYNL